MPTREITQLMRPVLYARLFVLALVHRNRLQARQEKPPLQVSPWLVSSDDHAVGNREILQIQRVWLRSLVRECPCCTVRRNGKNETQMQYRDTQHIPSIDQK